MKIISSITVWGDSIMRGVIFDAAASKYKFLKNSAVSLFTKTFPIRVDNRSRFGTTAPRALEAMRKSLTGTDESELILLEFGGNDCDYNWAEVSKDPYADHQPNTPIPQFHTALREMIQTVQAAGKRPAVMSLPPIDSTRYFDFITTPENVDSDRVLTFLSDKEFIYRHQERYSNAVCRVAAEMKVPLIDVREKFLMQRNVRKFLCIDGIHPDEEGQKLIHEVFADTYEIYSSSR